MRRPTLSQILEATKDVSPCGCVGWEPYSHNAGHEYAGVIFPYSLCPAHRAAQDVETQRVTAIRAAHFARLEARTAWINERLDPRLKGSERRSARDRLKDEYRLA